MSLISNKSVKLFYVCNIIIPLLIGLIFYYVNCSDVLFVRWIDGFLSISRTNMELEYSPIIVLVRNYLMDIIWQYSFVFALFVLINSSLFSLITAVITSITCGIIFECLQLIHVISGTFDIFDICLGIVSSLTAGLIIFYTEEFYEKN